jgi:hypothetical protein
LHRKSWPADGGQLPKKRRGATVSDPWDQTTYAAMQLPYHVLDVFSEERFGGNPLAVVLDAGALDGAAMQ